MAPAGPPTASFVGSSPIPNLIVQIVALIQNGGPTAVAAGAAAGAGDSKECTATELTTATNNCQYALRFSLTKIPSKGVLNQAVSVNIQDSTGKAVSTVVVTINLNCAPVFNSLVANIGVSPSLATQTTLNLGKEITFVVAPTTTNPKTEYMQAASPGLLASFAVDFNIPAGVGTTGAVVPASPLIPKVWINCQGATPALILGATSVVGKVTVSGSNFLVKPRSFQHSGSVPKHVILRLLNPNYKPSSNRNHVKIDPDSMLSSGLNYVTLRPCENVIRVNAAAMSHLLFSI